MLVHTGLSAFVVSKHVVGDCDNL